MSGTFVLFPSTTALGQVGSNLAFGAVRALYRWLTGEDD
jgi:hypothetical protein